MIKKLALICFLAFVSFAARSQASQNWHDYYFEPNGGVTRLYADTISDRLYLNGQFNMPSPQFVQYDGTAFSPHPLVSPLFPSIVDLRRVNGDLYGIGGGLFKRNGNSWDTIGIVSNGWIYGVLDYNNELYVYGMFDSINGVPARAFAKWDGSTWSALASVHSLYPFCYDATIYNGSLYFGGAFQTADQSIKYLARWDGNSLYPVSGVGHVKCLQVYNNELYIGGAFSFTNWAGATTSCIARWNGTMLNDVGGGGLVITGPNGGIRDFTVFDNALYAVGGFYSPFAHTSSIIRWDGTNWCGFDTYFNYAESIEVYHDSLFVGGELNVTPTIKHITKWIGTNFADSCGNATAIIETTDDLSVNLFPNPFNEFVIISVKGTVASGFDFILYDQYGREVRRIDTVTDQSLVVHREGLGSGIYYYRVLASENKKLMKAGKLMIIE